MEVDDQSSEPLSDDVRVDVEAVRRRRAAVAAAEEVASRYGIVAGDPQVLKDSNNTIVHLAPLSVVAKVSTRTLPGRDGALDEEMAVLRFLADAAAPAGPDLGSFRQRIGPVNEPVQRVSSR